MATAGGVYHGVELTHYAPDTQTQMRSRVVDTIMRHLEQRMGDLDSQGSLLRKFEVSHHMTTISPLAATKYLDYL